MYTQQTYLSKDCLQHILYRETQEESELLWLARYTVHALRLHEKKFRYSRKFTLIELSV